MNPNRNSRKDNDQRSTRLLIEGVVAGLLWILILSQMWDQNRSEELLEVLPKIQNSVSQVLSYNSECLQSAKAPKLKIRISEKSSERADIVLGKDYLFQTSIQQSENALSSEEGNSGLTIIWSVLPPVRSQVGEMPKTIRNLRLVPDVPGSYQVQAVLLRKDKICDIQTVTVSVEDLKGNQRRKSFPLRRGYRKIAGPLSTDTSTFAMTSV